MAHDEEGRPSLLGASTKALREQASALTEQVTSRAETALSSMQSSAAELGHSIGEAAANTRDSYQEALDEMRDSLPGFRDIIAQAARMPGVSVDRTAYLSTVLNRRCDQRTIRLAIETTPARAGIKEGRIDHIARSSIAKERRRTTLISAAAGIPGGAAMAATVPADLVQFWMHLLRVLQKLSYLYGWSDLVSLDGHEPDAAKRSALVLFLAMMAGVEEADDSLRSLAVMRVAGATERDLREALLREPYASAVATSAELLGQRAATRVTGQVASKTVPIVGAVISGRVSNASFNDMAKRLYRQLRTYGG